MKLSLLFAAFLVAGLGSCSATAQTVETTPNVISNNWTGVTQTTSVGGGYSGGNVPGYNPSTNTVMFGYTTSTVAQTYAINQALSGSGVQIGGYNYSWQYLNNGSTGGTLSSTISLTSPTGTTLESYNYAMNTIADGWRTMSGTQNFNQQYGLASVGDLNISFTGKDARFWAGLYGPQVRDVNLSLNYTSDPCASNPLYSPSCPNYNQVLTSQNIAAQSYAINQALNLSGSGVRINGFEYGYHYYVGGDWCSASFLGIFCTAWDRSSMAVDVNVTSNTGSSLYTATHNHNAQNTGGQPSYSFVFPTQRSLSSMGNFSLTTRETGSTALYSSWSRWQYTPDPCVANPLSSTTCEGYQAAYLNQQCTANPLYNSACPGYAEAMFNQQCTASPLHHPTCPGYAAAYLTYQCSINPLYSTTCPGYDEAYLNDQCIKDSLYSNKCEGYATAYAIKYLVTGIDSTVVNQALSDTAAVKANDPSTTKVAVNTVTTSINTDGSISTGVSTTGDTNVDKAIAPKTSSPSGSQPAAAVQLTAPPPAPQQMAQNEPRGGGREGGKDKQEDRKDDAPKGTGGSNSPQNTNTTQASSDKPAAPTARQAIQERRQAAARAEAVEKGKNLAGEMGKAADMESQKAVQNVVIQAMGFTPGFDAYGKTMIPDVAGYKPFTVYNNQRNIDNRANLRMFGGTDRLHNEMVDSQYNKGK
jgi:hypothetical protein